ncbi:MAG: hypothetical protein IT357_08380 [Gemmatimonadaceae bacterium]|nr:hypothetical protein [Gemmatimonadaceae bacterium]
MAKTSKLGTQFFAHYRKHECDAALESAAHLEAKRAVYEGCIQAGWAACTEAVGPDGAWRADVLANRDGQQIAFEVQLSRQNAQKTKERHALYAAHGVQCYWFFRRVPFSTPDRSIPAVALLTSDDGSNPEIALGPRKTALRVFVSSILSGRIRYAPVLRVDRPQYDLVIRRTPCDHCAQEVLFASKDSPPDTAVCGLKLADTGWSSGSRDAPTNGFQSARGMYSEHLPSRVSESLSPNRFLLESPPGKPFMTAVGRSGFCPSCHKVVAITESSDQLPIELGFPRVGHTDPYALDLPHWCRGRSGTFCTPRTENHRRPAAP